VIQGEPTGECSLYNVAQAVKEIFQIKV
jgi:hypothetical protein